MNVKIISSNLNFLIEVHIVYLPHYVYRMLVTQKATTGMVVMMIKLHVKPYLHLEIR